MLLLINCGIIVTNYSIFGRILNGVALLFSKILIYVFTLPTHSNKYLLNLNHKVEEQNLLKENDCVAV